MVTGLIVLFLIAAPVLVTVVGHWTRAEGIRQEHAERTWRQVSATVQRGRPAQLDGFSRRAGSVWVVARWTAPDGQVRSGGVPLSPGAEAGSIVRIWVSGSGALTAPPLRRVQLQERIALVEVVTVSALALILYLLGHTGRFVLDRRRLVGWEDAWRAVGPRWTRQR